MPKAREAMRFDRRHFDHSRDIRAGAECTVSRARQHDHAYVIVRAAPSKS